MCVNAYVYVYCEWMYMYIFFFFYNSVKFTLLNVQAEFVEHVCLGITQLIEVS